MSFAKEMSDFFGAAKTMSSIVSDGAYKNTLAKYYEANTPDDEDDKLEKDQKRANIEATKARTAASNWRIKLLTTPQPNATVQGINNGSITPGSAGATTPAPPPAPAPAIPQDTSSSDDSNGGGDTQFAAAGGAIQAPQNSASDPSNPPMPGYDQQGNVDPTTARAIPKSANDGPDAEDDDDDDDAPQFSADAGSDAILGALKYQYGNTNAQAIPGGARQPRRGVAPMPIDDMDAIYKAIDPHGKMSESERNANALSAVWQMKMHKGDLQGAQHAAAQMLQYYQANVQRYAAIASAAAQKGNIDGAAKAAMKAYANIPDRKDLKVWKSDNGQLGYSYTDENGKQIAGGLVTPDQLAAQAMGVATKNFYPFLLQAAGQNLAKSQKGAVGGDGAAPKPMKPGDRTALQTDVDRAYDVQFTGKDKNGKDLQPLPDEQARAIKGNAMRMVQRNPQLTTDEGVDIIKRLMSPNKDNPDKPDYTMKKLDDEDGGGRIVRFGKGPSVRMSDDEWDAVNEARAAKVAQMNKDKAAADKQAKEPGLWDRIKGAASAASDKIGKIREDNERELKRGAEEDAEKPAPKQAIPAPTDDDAVFPTGS